VKKEKTEPLFKKNITNFHGVSKTNDRHVIEKLGLKIITVRGRHWRVKKPTHEGSQGDELV